MTVVTVLSAYADQQPPHTEPGEAGREHDQRDVAERLLTDRLQRPLRVGPRAAVAECDADREEAQQQVDDPAAGVPEPRQPVDRRAVGGLPRRLATALEAAPLVGRDLPHDVGLPEPCRAETAHRVGRASAGQAAGSCTGSRTDTSSTCGTAGARAAR